MIEVKRSNTYRSSILPMQKTSSSAKNEEWAKQCVSAIIGMSNSSMRNGRTTRQNKQINYDLYNSKFDEEDWDYVTKPYGLNEKYKTATKMQNYNLIRPNIEVLKGEEIKRPFNFFAKATNVIIVYCISLSHRFYLYYRQYMPVHILCYKNDNRKALRKNRIHSLVLLVGTRS